MLPMLLLFFRIGLLRRRFLFSRQKLCRFDSAIIAIALQTNAYDDDASGMSEVLFSIA